MSDNERYKSSFNFNESISNKRCILLSNNTPCFNKLPVSVIRYIFKMVATIADGYYYYITDLHSYPKKFNKYIGRCCEQKKNSVKISYNGWNDSFDEWVPRQNISYLDKTQMPVYHVGDNLDILDKVSSEWFNGLVCDVRFTDNYPILTVIYRLRKSKKLIIMKDIPIYYKYISPSKRHTGKVWHKAPLSSKIFNFYKQRNYEELINHVKTIATRIRYILEVREITI